MRYDLRGKTVLITGGGSGLGRQLALRAAERDAAVVIWDISPEAGEATQEMIADRGGQALSLPVDVSDRDAVTEAAVTTGPVDVLINNAGVITGKRLTEAFDAEIEHTFAVNTLSLFWVTRAFLDGMISRGHGTVVTVASTAGLVGVPQQTDYSASKFAAFGFAESLRAELVKDNTGVNSLIVCPSYLDTGLFDGVRTRFPLILPRLKADKVAEKVIRHVEQGKSQLIMPPLARTIPVARAMHLKHFDHTMGFFGASSAMDGFRGRSRRDIRDSLRP